MLLLGGNINIIMIFVSMIWILGLELIFLLIRILQMIGIWLLDGDKMMLLINVISIQREVVQNGIEISGGWNGEKGFGGVLNIGG